MLITRNVYNIIKSTYCNNKYCIKTKLGMTENFISTSEVKQGCTLSPTLSNIFQNEIHHICDESCNPDELDGILFNSYQFHVLGR